MTAYAATKEQARRHSQSDCGSSAMSAIIMRHAICACLILFVLLVLVGLVAAELLGLLAISIISIILARVILGIKTVPAKNKA